MSDPFDECDKLTGHAREICRGRAGISGLARASYLERWAAEGKITKSLLPELLSGIPGGSRLWRPSPDRKDCCDGRQDAPREQAPERAVPASLTAVPAWLSDRRRALSARRAEAAAQSCGPPEYVALDRLAADTLSLVPRLPSDVSVVVGVARSGMLPASILALYLHRPLFAMSRDGVIDCGHGWRLGTGDRHGIDVAGGTALIVDDTLMTGGSLQQARAIAEGVFRRRLHAHVYVNPRSGERPDLFAAYLPAPHVLEWNLFNSLYLGWSAFDFDGVFCRDFTPEEDDDGERYIAALEKMPPLLLPRKAPVHIITARLEKYRSHTEGWLKRWGVAIASLTMGPWGSKAERDRADVAAWKAEELGRLYGGMKPQSWFGGPLYVESDPGQAARIAKLTGEIAVCPTVKKCFR